MTPLEREIIHREMVAPRTDMTPLEREIIHREMVTPITNMTATEREIILREMVTPSPGMTLLEREIIGREMFTPRTAMTPLEREVIDLEMVNRFKEMIDREIMNRDITRVPRYPFERPASSWVESNMTVLEGRQTRAAVEEAYERLFPFTSFIMTPEDLHRKHPDMSGTFRTLPLTGTTMKTSERYQIFGIPSETFVPDEIHRGKTASLAKEEKNVVHSVERLLPRIAESLEDTETKMQQQRMRGHGL
eukprot:GHVS01030934.1.p1 GENE.GHVS01030934.1~~GHVS01030934.1.p1  ORF type:complete len:248 (+),score=19.64 GHVS01030934.1:1-744(+)